MPFNSLVRILLIKCVAVKTHSPQYFIGKDAWNIKAPLNCTILLWCLDTTSLMNDSRTGKEIQDFIAFA